VTARKQALVERSAALRVRLSGETQWVRASLHGSPVTVGIRRVARLTTGAARLLIYFRAARSIFSMARAIAGRGR